MIRAEYAMNNGSVKREAINVSPSGAAYGRALMYGELSLEALGSRAREGAQGEREKDCTQEVLVLPKWRG